MNSKRASALLWLSKQWITQGKISRSIAGRTGNVIIDTACRFRRRFLFQRHCAMTVHVQREAKLILENAAKAGLTTHNYLWIVTQSVVGDPNERINLRDSLPVGMLGRPAFSFSPESFNPFTHQCAGGAKYKNPQTTDLTDFYGSNL